MGKGDKVSRLEQIKKGIKSTALSNKVVKSGNAIKKETAAVPAAVIAKPSDGDIEMKKKKSRPSSKKRRFLQLIKSNPKRDEKPKQLIDLQV